MRKFLLTAAFISLSHLIFAQTDFRPGYVVTHDADTLHGLVDYNEGPNAYRVCTFKQSKDDQSTSYKPNEISSYGFADDKLFTARQITMPDKTSEHVFLEVILKGLVSLYKFNSIFWIDKGGKQLSYLTNESELTTIEGQRFARSSNQHIATLNMFLFDCIELRSRIERIHLHERQLSKLVQDYNTCQGVPVVNYKIKKPWKKFTLGLTSGGNISQIEFEPNAFNEHLAGSFVVSKSALLGFSLGISSPKLSERISFHADAFFTRSKYHNFRLVEESTSTRRNYTTIEVEQLKLPLGFRYTFPDRKFRPYVNAGLSNTFHLSSGSSWVLERESNNAVETFQQEALQVGKNQLGIWGGLGVLTLINHKFNAFFELRYEQTEGLSGGLLEYQDAANSKIRNIQILIGIRTR
jgi:hypothetical protein